MTAEQNDLLRAIVRRLLEKESQVSLAARIGDVTNATISGFLKGKQGIRLPLALKIVQLAGEDPKRIWPELPEEFQPRRFVEYDGRFPNYDIAKRFALRDADDTLKPFVKEAVRQLDSTVYNAEEDPPPRRWLAIIEARAFELQRAAREPYAAKTTEKAARLRDEARAKWVAKETRPKVPKRRPAGG